MKKRVISLFLTIPFFMFSLFVGITANAKTDYSKYKSKVKSAIKCCEKVSYDGYLEYASPWAGGFLYDFDGNKQKELVLYYHSGKDKNDSKLVMSVYTIKNNNVKTLIKRKKLSSDIPTTTGFVGIATKKGNKYLICQGEDGETSGPELHRWGHFWIYKIKGTKIKLVSKVVYNITAKGDGDRNVIDSKSTIKLNGNKITYKKFVKWQKSFKIYKATRSWQTRYYLGYTYQSKGTPLKMLLDSL